MKKNISIVIVLLLFVYLPTLSSAADWPMQGHDAAHSGVAGESVEPPLEVLWKYKTGAGYSSPAVSGGMVYVGSNDGYVYALDASSGSLKWKYKTGDSVASSPAVSGGVVYVGSHDGYVYALDASSGNLKWKYKTGGGGSSPAVSGGVVYVGSHWDYFYAFAPAPTPTPTTGTISVSSAPSGASIYLDGIYKGTTPEVFYDVPVGSHTVKITKAGYGDKTRNITVLSENPIQISETLTRNEIYEKVSEEYPAYDEPAEEDADFPVTYGNEPFYQKNDDTVMFIIFILFVGIIFIVVSKRKKFAKLSKGNITSDISKSAQPSAETTTTAATGTQVKTDNISIKSAFQYKGATIQYKVKIINQTPDPISDIKIHLFVPEVFMLTQKEKSIPMLEPGESKTVTFDIHPTGECGDCIVSGRMNYYDYGTKTRQDVDIKKKMISIVCPFLKRKEIDEDGWRNATEELIKAEENTKDLDIPAENLFNIATRVLKDMSMYMIPPEITSTPQLFTGVGMFYADGAAGLRYAAYIEVVGGRKSRMILKAWAEKEEALTGFYHRILDEIEKRLDIKIFIDEGIIQHHVHKTEIKDNIIQRSNIDLGTRAQCPECGREVEANEKFCLECGAKL